jgi:hypothetical protein
MNSWTYCLLAAAFLIFGCGNPGELENLSGPPDEAQIYNAPFDRVWRAVVAATSDSEFSLQETNQATGSILVGKPNSPVPPSPEDPPLQIKIKSLPGGETEVTLAFEEAEENFEVRQFRKKLFASITTAIEAAGAEGPKPGP